MASRSPRAQEIVEAARTMIEAGDGARLTMRRLAGRLRIQAPSLYKHFADKEAITAAVHADYLAEQLAALEAALVVRSDEHPLVRVMTAYRRFAVEHRHLFDFVFALPYPDAVDDVLRGLRRIWLRAAGDSDLAVSAYAMARGMAEMEVHSLFPLPTMPADADNQGVLALVLRAEQLAADQPAR